MTLRTLCVALALVPLLLAPAGACDLLPEAVLRQAIAVEGGPLSQLSQLPGRCQYQWPKADRAAREASNADALRSAFDRGSSGYQPLSLWNEVTVELLAVGETEAAARSLFDSYAGGRVPERFGSPDPLAGAGLERLPAGTAKQQRAWSPQRRQLLIQQGPRLLLMGVNVEDDPDKNRAAALSLGDGVK